MLNWFTTIRQFFDRINDAMGCADGLGAKLADYMKCRSNCCNNVNIYNPKNCGIMGGVSNRWIRAVTPNCAKKGESNVSEFYTPKN